MDACKLSITISWAGAPNFLQSIFAAKRLDEILSTHRYGGVVHDSRAILQWHFQYRPLPGGIWTVEVQHPSLKDKVLAEITEHGFAVVSEGQ